MSSLMYLNPCGLRTTLFISALVCASASTAAPISFDGGPAGTGTLWNDPLNWNPDQVPGAGDEAIISGFATDANGIFTVQSVNVDALGSIAIGTNQRVTLSQDSINNGVIRLQDINATASNRADFNVGTSPVTLNGVGSVLFSTGLQNSIASGVGGSLTLGGDMTVRTENAGNNGVITAELVNLGTVEADAGTITLSTNDKANSGTIAASNAGLLVFASGLNVDNSGGVIDIDATSLLQLNSSAEVIGGLMQGGGIVDVSGNTTLTGPTSLNDLTFQIGTNDTLNLVGAIENNSVIELRDINATASNFATLHLDGSSPTGAGEIVFATGLQNRVNGTGPVTLTSGQVIRTSGAGAFGAVNAELTNDGLINVLGGTISLATADKVNNAQILVQDNGLLRLENGIDINNVAGTIDIEAGSVMNLSNGSAITGGTIGGGGTIEQDIGNTTIADLELNNLTWNLSTNETLALNGLVTNNSTLVLADIQATSTNFATLNLQGTSPTGVGEIQFATGLQNRILGSAPVTLTAQQTVRTVGAGSRGDIQAELTNLGLISTMGGTILLSNDDKVNASLIEAGSGGLIDVRNGIAIDNSTGVISIDGSSRLNFSNGSTLTGGLIDGGGLITQETGLTTIGDVLTLQNMTLQIDVNETLRLTGALENNSVIELRDGSATATNFATLDLGATSMTGVGEVLFTTGLQNRILSDVAVDLTVDQVIRTSGVGSRGDIAAELSNQGLISTMGGTIFLSNDNKVNASLIEAGSGGLIDVRSGIAIDNSAGVISIDGSSRLNFSNGSTLTGGLIDGGGLVTQETGLTTIGDGLTLQNMTWQVDVNETLRLTGALENNSVIELGDGSATATNFATLDLGATSMTGVGEVIFTTGLQNRIISSSAVTLTGGQVIRTLGVGHNGDIQAALTNEGLISSVGGRISLSSTDKVNNAVIEANGGAFLGVSAGVEIDNRLGLIAVDGTSELNLASGSRIRGGVVSGGGTVEIASGAVTLDGTDAPGIVVDGMTVNIGVNETLSVSGVVENNSQIRLVDNSATATNFATFSGSGGVAEIIGSGEIVFATGLQNRLTGDGFLIGMDQLLRVDSGNNGQFATNVTSHGEVRVNGGLAGAQNLVNATGGVLTGDGLLDSSVNGATLQNDGTVTAQEATGDDIGSLTLQDLVLDLGASGNLLFDIDGPGGQANRGITNDFIEVIGNGAGVNLGGSLALNLLGMNAPSAVDEYFLLFSNQFSGDENSFLNVSGGIGLFDFGQAGVRIENGFLIVSDIRVQQVPAPGALLILMLGIAAVAWRRGAST